MLATSPIFSSIIGRLGAASLCTRHQALVLRLNGAPTGEPTARQIFVRESFYYASTIWALTFQAYRDSWNNYALIAPPYTRHGRRSRLSGYLHWCRMLMLYFEWPPTPAGFPYASVDPADPAPLSLVSLTVTANLNGTAEFELVVTLQDPPPTDDLRDYLASYYQGPRSKDCFRPTHQFTQGYYVETGTSGTETISGTIGVEGQFSTAGGEVVFVRSFRASWDCRFSTPQIFRTITLPWSP